MKVLGIDPGLANTGWSIIEPVNNGKFEVCDIGIIKTKKSDDFSTRLSCIVDTLVEVAKRNSIKYASAEDIFFTKNISSAIDVAKVIGAFDYAFSKNGIQLFLYTPTRIKQIVSGGGKADKNFMKKMVSMQLEKPLSVKTDHEYDSVAAGITFLLDLKSKILTG